MAALSYFWATPAAPAAIAWLQSSVHTGICRRALPAPGRVGLRMLLDAKGQEVDEVVIWRSSEAGLELGTHGGPGVREAIDAALASHGFVRTEAPEDPWARLARAASPAACQWLLRHPDDEPAFPVEWLHRTPVVLLTGPANAGKSTLLNAWCGQQRAVVSGSAGTTRDLVAAETLVGGWRLRLIDSAGLRTGGDELEQEGQSLAKAARAWVDLVVYLDPPGQADVRPQAGDLRIVGKADLLSGPWPELAWAGPAFIGAQRAEAQLERLGRAVLQALRLPWFA